MFFQRIKIFLPYLNAYRREIAIGLTALALTDLLGLTIPWLLKTVVDLLPQKPPSAVLIQYAGLLFLAASFVGLFRFGWRKYLFGSSRKIERDILNRLFAHFLTLDKTFFQTWRVGDLMSRATNDLRAVRDFMGLGLLLLLDSVISIVACVSLMVYINPKLTLYTMLPLPIVTILFYKFSSSISRRHLAVQEHLAKISSMVQENLAGIRVIHAYVQEEYEKQKFEELNREYLKKNMSLTQLFGLFTPSLVFLMGVAVLISLWLGAKAVIAEEMTLGSFVAFNGYLMMMSWPVMGIGYMFNLSQKGLTAMGRLEEVLTIQPRVGSRPPRQTDREIQGEIEFRNLCFTYPGETRFGLRDINLQFPKGTCTAILGAVGAGKTTLVQLIPRIFDCQSGTLLIDGESVRDIPLSNLRRSIGYVDQGPYLFSTSIKNNIAFGRDGGADEEEILQVVQIAALTPDLSTFPQGLETLVGERGVSLSGGQKQRIALARALLRKPKILILDDAFSSLDVETEETILKNIGNYIHGMTTIIVTHRLSTIRHVDQIAVMENGGIIERGTHADLLQHRGYYYKIFKDQALAREMNIYMP